MLIGFVGLPNSGKTTIAAKLFAALKEISSSSELVVEHARLYIAKKRIDEKIGIKDKISLTDSDQFNICKRQTLNEEIMSTGSSKYTYVISDSSTTNSMHYVSEDVFNDPDYRKYMMDLASKYDLIFYCHPFQDEVDVYDPNRVHNKEEISKLNDRSNKILKLIKDNGCNVKEILGAYPLDLRWKECYNITTTEYFKYIQTVKE